MRRRALGLPLRACVWTSIVVALLVTSVAVVIDALLIAAHRGPVPAAAVPAAPQDVGSGDPLSTRRAPPTSAVREPTTDDLAPPGAGVDAVRAGIPIGDGTFLAPLNGVCIDDGIPPIGRDPRLPPPGPVVGRYVDPSGQEWWVHADGSQTSCSFASVTLADGTERILVSTQHGAPVVRGGAPPCSRRGARDR